MIGGPQDKFAAAIAEQQKQRAGAKFIIQGAGVGVVDSEKEV